MLIAASALTGFFSCDEDKDDLSDVAILVSPKAETGVVLFSGEKARYQLDFYTTHERVSRMKVRSFNAVEGELTLLDTTFAAKPSTYDFIYTAPYVSRDSIDVLLTFEAWDDAGSQCEVRRNVTVKSQSAIIAEKSGIVLWSPQSGRADALSFSDPSQTFNWRSSPDSVNADIYLTANDGFTLLSLRSNTKAKLVRNNSFDYASATALGTQIVYESSRRSDLIDQLNTNDIILVGHDSRAEGIIRIQNIIRSDDTDECCVQIAFKGIASFN